jgi:hypothetical protein
MFPSWAAGGHEDIAGGTHNGTKVQVWDCNGQLNQKWHR